MDNRENIIITNLENDSEEARGFLEGMKKEIIFELGFLERWRNCNKRNFTINDFKRKIRELQYCLRLIDRKETQLKFNSGEI